MKNLITLICLLFLPAFLYSQNQGNRIFQGKVICTQTGSGVNNFTVSCNFTDEGGLYDGTNVQIGDKLYFTDGGYGYYLPIDSIISLGPSTVVVRVSSTGTGLGAIPNSIGFISSSTDVYGFFPFVSGLSNADQQINLENTFYNLDSLLFYKLPERVSGSIPPAYTPSSDQSWIAQSNGDGRLYRYDPINTEWLEIGVDTLNGIYSGSDTIPSVVTARIDSVFELISLDKDGYFLVQYGELAGGRLHINDSLSRMFHSDVAGNNEVIVSSNGIRILPNTNGPDDIMLEGSILLNKVLSPSSISTNQNNYSPSGLTRSNFVRLTSSANVNITGLGTGNGRVGRIIGLHNVGSFKITLKNNSVSSLSANRFALSNDHILSPNDVILLQYDTSSTKWRIFGTPRQYVDSLSMNGGTLRVSLYDDNLPHTELNITENIQDIVGGMIGTQTNISVTYNDATGKINYIASGGGGGGGDDWGAQVVETDASLIGDGTAGDPLKWDGNFVSLPITGTGLSGAPLDILANSIDTSHIATNGVGADELRPGAVGSSELAQQGATTGQVMKWNGSAWAPGADNGATGTGASDEVAVFSGASTLTSYPELAFDGSVLSLEGDVNIEKNTPSVSIVDNAASGSTGGGLLNINCFDGTAIGAGHRLGAIQFMGSAGGAGTAVGGLIESFAYTNFSGTSAASSLVLSTPNIGTYTHTQRLRLSPLGVEARSGSALNLWNATNTARHTISSFEDSIMSFEPNVFSEGGELYFTGEITSSTTTVDLTSDRNNLFVGTNLFVAISAETTNRNITGIQHRSATGATRYLVLHNDGGGGSHLNNIVLKNQDVASSATNRFALAGGDLTLEPYESVLLAHIPTSGLDRWVVLGSSKTAGGGSYTDEQAQDAAGGVLVDGSTIDFTYDDATPSITAEVKSNVIQDGGNTTGAAVTIGTNDANALNLEVNNTTGLTMGTDYSLTATASVSNTNTVANRLIIETNSTGTPAANFGGGILFRGESSTTNNRDMVRLMPIWTTATDASREAKVSIQLGNNAGALAEIANFNVSGNNEGELSIGSTSALTINNGGITPSKLFQITNNNLTILSGGSTGESLRIASSSNSGYVNFGNTTYNNTSSTKDFARFASTFSPTSGTGQYVDLQFITTINQTGGANGNSRAILINPTLTAVGGTYYAIDIAANSASAKGIYQSGSSTTNNFVGGTMFGSTSAPASVAAVEISSTTKGLLLPRMTTTQRDAITAVAGLVIFNTTTTKMECYDGTTWQAAW